MRAGRLRKRVSLQRRVETQDTTGGMTVTWAEVAKLWAGIEPLYGREYDAARARNAETTHRIVLRYREDVTAQMRLVLGARIYRIDEILNVRERNAELHLRATELAA